MKDDFQRAPDVSDARGKIRNPQISNRTQSGGGIERSASTAGRALDLDAEDPGLLPSTTNTAPSRVRRD